MARLLTLLLYKTSHPTQASSRGLTIFNTMGASHDEVLNLTKIWKKCQVQTTTAATLDTSRPSIKPVSSAPMATDGNRSTTRSTSKGYWNL
jgi:hypothetical protein